MKAIAEYFRDLAADDRYFGAEPPTPDADMLQRIAEREIRRRVDAHVDGENVVLRANAGTAPPEPTALRAPEPTPEPAPAPQAPAAPAPVAADPVSEPAPQPVPMADPAPQAHADPVAPAPVSDPAPAAPDASDEDSVAAKLARIRAVVQTARSAPDAADEGDSTFIEDEHAAAPASAPVAQPADLPVDEIEDAVEVAQDVTEADEIAEIEEAPIEEEVAAEIEESVAPVEEDLEDTAEESETAADQDIADDYVEDTAEVEDDQPLDISALAARLSAEKEALRTEAVAEDGDADEVETEEVAFEDNAQDEDTAETAVFTEQDMLDEIQDVPAENPLAVLDDAAPEETDETDAEAPQEVDPAQARRAERRARRAGRRTQERQPRNEEDARDAAARARARVMKVKRDELEDMRASLIESDLIPGAKDGDKDAAQADTPPLAEETPDADTPRIRPLRVLKRARKAPEADPEVETAVERDIEDEGQDDITTERDETPILASDDADLDDADDLGLSPEDEADLMAELAEVERDTAPATPSAPAMDAPEAPKAKTPAGGVTDVSRLVEEVNTKMEGSEHKRRRSAIAHLKAAVAATVAERGLGRNRDRETEDEVQRTPYRADLSAVVRPAAKPEAKAKMPPLMLVSEQRIDRPAGQAAQRSAGNLALRAVENDTLDDDDQDDVAGQGNIFADDDTFADFAERHGANALPDILECAAAYLARVEGQDSFTRPEVMNTVAEFMGADRFQREDGLRAFGQLLREGPLERHGRGAFTIAATSRFMSA